MGSLIFRYINGNLIDNLGVSQAFLYWGIIVLLLVLIGSFFLREAIVSNAVTETLHNDYTRREMMRTKQVYLLFYVIHLVYGWFVFNQYGKRYRRTTCWT